MRSERRRRGIEIDMETEEEPVENPSAPLLQSDEDEAKEYESILDSIGFGRFQILLLFVCGWANASDAVEILCVSFILPSAQCDLTLSSTDKGILTAVIFLGMMFGGYVWGSVGDSIGRKKTLITSLLVNALGGAISAFSGSFLLFTIARFLSGLGVGGSVPVVWSYFAEFQVARNRGAMLSLLASSWMVGNILTACLAWLIIPLHINLALGSLGFDSWRLFVLVCIFPAVTSALFLLLFPESPKFLLSKRRGSKAKAVLIKIYAMNHGNSAPCPFAASPLFAEVDRKETSAGRKGVKQTLIDGLEKTRKLFRKPHRLNNYLMLVIFFTISFGYYGMWLWMPELFSMASAQGRAPCSIYKGNASATVSPPQNDTSPCTPPTETFVDSLVSTVATLPGNLVTIFCVDRVGRRPLLIASMVLSGISVFFMWLVQTNAELLVLSCCFGGFSIVGWNVLDCLSCELFPTELRSTAIGLQLGLGRVAAILGNLVFGALITVDCSVPILLVAAFMTIGGLTALKLPKTSGKVLT